MEPLALALLATLLPGPGGDLHTCRLDPDGSVWCWGANDEGQAGVSGPNEVEAPTKNEALAAHGEVVALSTGSRHSCATLRSGETTCWGRLRTHPVPPPRPREAGGGGGGYGTIGLGTLHRAVTVRYIDGPDGLVQHASGSGFSCGVRAAGSVVCWGTVPSDPGRYGVVEQPLRDAVQVVAGAVHACALRESGEVLCWRGNEHGQLGDGGVDDQPSPVRVQGLPPVASLTAGVHHTCALTRQGEVFCWGSRRGGALGDGLADGEMREAQRVELATASALQARGDATCALTDDGPMCWGRGPFAPEEGLYVAAPDVVQAVAGEGHTCARDADGDVWCWGQQGRRGDDVPGDSGVPTKVLSGAIDLAAGREHTCAVRQGGTVSCWGDNGFGQVDGEHDGTATPVRVRVPPLVDLALGDQASCGRDAQGTAWCWGDGGARIGSAGTPHTPTPLPVPALGPGTLHLGDSIHCALHEGRVRCMGEGWDHAFGDGTTNETSATLRTADVDGLEQVLGAGRTTCGLRADHSLWCWGSWSDDKAPPHEVIADVAAAAVGPYGRGCAVGASDGAVRCWGDMGPPFSDDPLPTPTVLPDVSDVAQLVMGEDHTCARHGDGTVTCWGRWRGGQGYGRPWAAREPKRLELTGVAELVAGSNHTCARTDTGEVWCWGAADKGQSGLGTRERQSTPTRIPSLDSVVDLAAGPHHTCARTPTDTYCWGDDGQGQLGNGSYGERPLPTVVPYLDNAVAVAAGYTTTCATPAAGAPVCWGRDDVRDTYVFNAEQPWSPAGDADLKRVLGLGDQGLESQGGSVAAVAVGDRHACGLGDDGSVWCWGSNAHGQLGHPGPDPAPVPGITGATDVIAGPFHTCALTADGLRCWGRDHRGQLGRGLPLEHHTPTPVSPRPAPSR